MSQSLNVSVATALILFEAQRQREAAGFYENRGPEPQGFPLDWCYPSVAKKFKVRYLEMPKIDKEGNLLFDSPTP